MADRYYVETPIAGEFATLAGQEAHHLLHVMRAKAGDQVMLFDGSGAEFSARVERLGRSDVELAILSRAVVDRELDFELTLAVALPKGDRQRWLVEKATEIGVTRIVPLSTERSVIEAGAGALKRLERSVIEASKQCGRNKLMRIEPEQPAAMLLADVAAEDVRLLAHPGGELVNRLAIEQTAQSPGRICVAIGPEGGFTDAEVALAREHGWRIIDLGPRILRVETAAVCLASFVATITAR